MGEFGEICLDCYADTGNGLVILKDKYMVRLLISLK